jgi:hypothetical protein
MTHAIVLVRICCVVMEAKVEVVVSPNDARFRIVVSSSFQGSSVVAGRLVPCGLVAKRRLLSVCCMQATCVLREVLSRWTLV